MSNPVAEPRHRPQPRPEKEDPPVTLVAVLTKPSLTKPTWWTIDYPKGRLSPEWMKSIIERFHLDLRTWRGDPSGFGEKWRGPRGELLIAQVVAWPKPKRWLILYPEGKLSPEWVKAIVDGLHTHLRAWQEAPGGFAPDPDHPL